MNLAELAVAIAISAALTAAGLVGVKVMLHNGKVQAIETLIRSVQQKSVLYGEMNGGSYKGLSCGGLQGMNLEPSSGCSSSNPLYFNSALSLGQLYVSPSGTAGFSIFFTPTDFSLTTTDCTELVNGAFGSISKSGCTLSSPLTWTLSFVN